MIHASLAGTVNGNDPAYLPYGAFPVLIGETRWRLNERELVEAFLAFQPTVENRQRDEGCKHGAR